MATAALVVGSDDSPVAVIKDLARQLGFSPVHTCRTVADLEARGQGLPVFFVLFASVDHLRRLAAFVRDIRSNGAPAVRFAPLVYFSENPSLALIRTCIDMGFDDIITVPFALGRVRERLARQLDRPLTYFSTETYFGPDRRGRIPNEEKHPMQGTGGTHRRIEIVRTASGIRVVQDDVQLIE